MAGPKLVPEHKALQSWKEIAAFLGVTVRSVQRWEDAGLPVYRQGSGKKARVFAYADELQEWVESGGFRQREPEAGPGESRRWGWYALAAGLALVCAAGLILWHSGVLPNARVPRHWAIEGSKLKVLDAGERLCWETRLPALSKDFESEVQDKVLIADIDDDGRTEVLLNFLPEKLGEKSGSLMCFEQDGRLRWEFRYGGPKTFGTRHFEPSYRGRLIRLVRIAGKPHLLTVANHYLWYPSQTALVDPKTGLIEEEYWHPGAVYHCVLADIDGDGEDEVLLGAINNPGEGLGHAALAVLKLPFSKAPRPQIAANDPLPPMTGGGELAYLLFPLPDVCRLMGQLPMMFRLSVDPRGRILVQNPLPESGAIVYYLDFRLRVEEYRFSDNFAALHERLFRQHLVDHRLSRRETESLGKVLSLNAAPDGNSPELRRFWEF